MKPTNGPRIILRITRAGERKDVSPKWIEYDSSVYAGVTVGTSLTYVEADENGVAFTPSEIIRATEKDKDGLLK